MGAAVVAWAANELYRTRWDTLAVVVMLGSVSVNLVVADFQVWVVEQATGARPLGMMMLVREMWRLLAPWLTTRVGWTLLSIMFSIGLFYGAWRCGHATGQRVARARQTQAPGPRHQPPIPPLAELNDPQERDADNDDARPRWQLMAMGIGTHHFQMTGAGHTMAERNKCCICDQEKDRTIRCQNIADYVCMNCVILWAVRNAGTNGNNWPCCRD